MEGVRSHFTYLLMEFNPLLTKGFTIFPNVLSRVEVAYIRQQLDTLDAIGTRCLLDFPWCRNTANQIKNCLATELPELNNLQPVQCTYFNKSTDMNWLVAFHQDRSIPVDDRTPVTTQGWSRKEDMTFIQPSDNVMSQMLALRLHLDDSTPSNGSLRILPTTHLSGTLSPQQIDRYRKTITPMNLVVSKGGVVAMRPLLLHASSKSQTRKPRRVLHFLLGPSSLPDKLQWRTAV